MLTIHEAFGQTILTVWSSFIDIAPCEPCAQSEMPDPQEHSLVGCIHIAGPTRYAIALSCPDPLARRIASVMFDMPADAIATAELQDAVGELTNMTGGNFKAVLEGDHHLSLPSVVDGRELRAKFPGGLLRYSLAFVSGGDTLIASLYIEDPVTPTRSRDAACAQTA